MSKQTIKRIINCTAFYAVIAVSVLVLLGKLIPVAENALFLTAGILAFCVCVFAGGYYAFSKRNAVYISLFIVCVVGSVVCFIIL